MNIAEKIYRLRTESDMTQTEFAKIAGVSDKAVSTWERGEKSPRMKPLQKICTHFGIDLNQFVDVESDVYKESPDAEQSVEELNEVEEQLVTLLRQLPPEHQKMVPGILQSILDSLK